MTDQESIHTSQNTSDTPLVSFGMISDIQYCNCDNEGRRYYRQSLEKLNQCVHDLNGKELSFVVNLGDLIEKDFSSYDTVLNILDQLSSPVYHVLGNHDFSVSEQEKSAVTGKLGIPDSYYDFEIGEFRFIVLNGCEISLFAPAENTKEYRRAKLIMNQLEVNDAHNAIDWNGAISPDQYRWLKNRIKTSEQEGEKVIIFCHFPVYPKLVYNLWNYQTLLSLFGRHKNIVAYFSGHNHLGSYAVYKHTHYLSLMAMVETPDHTAWCIVDVFNDRLEVTGYGWEKSRVLYFLDQ
jgi:manganese-dependent ADP-ribose/CDP-alcohol diphosphatase